MVISCLVDIALEPIGCVQDCQSKRSGVTIGRKGAAMIDKLFKLAVVALAAGLLWVYYINTQNGQNGRYQFHSNGIFVLDTREGIIYQTPVIQGTPSNTN